MQTQGRKLFILVLFQVFYACGDATEQSETSAVTKGASGDRFNLAQFVRTHPSTQALKTSVAPGDAFLFFGQAQKFRVETNLTVTVAGEPGYIGNTRGIQASYWLDGFVFNQKLGGTTKGFLVDAGASGNLNPVGAEAYIRFLGNDKYRGKLEAAISQTFMRDLNVGAVTYPVPLLGVKVGGNVGGEVGFNAAVGARYDGTLGLSFRPKANLRAGISGGLEALKFATAEAVGTVQLAGVDLAASANAAYLPAESMVYGGIGVDGGEFRAVDGKIEIVAKAGLNGLLPGGVDAGLWAAIAKAAGVNTNWEWRHTIWDPAAIYQRDLPGYGKSFMRFTAIASQCPTRKASAQNKLNQHAAILAQKRAAASGLDRIVLDASALQIQEIKTQLAGYCS